MIFYMGTMSLKPPRTLNMYKILYNRYIITLKTPFLLSHAFPKELGSSTGQAQKIAHHVPRFWLVWLDCMDIQENNENIDIGQ